MAKWEDGLLPEYTFTGEVKKKLGRIRRGNLSEHLPLEEMNTQESRRALDLLRMEECLRAVDDPTVQGWLRDAVLEKNATSKEIAVARLKMASTATSGSERKRRAALEACKFLRLRFPK